MGWGGGSPFPRVASNTIDNTILGAVDFLPTLCSIAKLPLNDVESLQGQDMSAAIVRLNQPLPGDASGDGNRVTVRPPAPRTSKPLLLWEWRFSTAGNCRHAAPQLAIRDGRFKLLRDIADVKDGHILFIGLWCFRL